MIPYYVISVVGFHRTEEKTTNRTKNSMRNIAFGLGGQILNILMSFAARVVLVHVLGDLYAGIAGNFTNILMVFSLADLGVGTAIIYALYKPIAHHDEQKIRQLMNLYSRAYMIIGCVIIGLGLMLLPFIDLLMKTDAVIPHLRLIFMLFVVNTASTYFLSYKGTLITANQKNYIVTNVTYGTSIANYVLQIVIILVTKNYLLSLGLQVFTNILQGVILWIIANRMYPYIRDTRDAKLPAEERKGIFRNVFSMVYYRVGQVVLNGTDSMVISSMIGVIENGIYSNYNLLLTTIKNLLQQVFHAITASVGNLNTLETEERKYSVFNMIFFGNFWMFGFSSVCFWELINPFIAIVFGPSRVMDPLTVFFLVLNFYLLGMRNTIITFRDTMGIFRQGRFIPLSGALINIVVSILLAPKLGIMGVSLGTTISIVATMLWLEPIVLFKHGFKGRSPMRYFAKYAMYLLVTAASAIATELACGLMFGEEYGIGFFILRMLMCMILPNAIFYVLFSRTEEFRELKGRAMSVLRRKLRKQA